MASATDLASISGTGIVQRTGAGAYSTLGTVPVSRGGTATTSFTANRIVATNGTGSALTSWSCPLGQLIKFDATGVVGCDTIANILGYVPANGASYVAKAGDAMTGRLAQSAAGFNGATKDDITTRTDSGFYQTSTATTAEGWPATTNGWYQLISSTHTNDSNYYSMQFASDYANVNEIYFRQTGGSGTAPWRKVWHSGNLTNLNQLTNGPGYITSINSSMVTTALGYTPVNKAGDTMTGALTATSFSGAGTGLTGTAAGLTAGAANSVAWANVAGKPFNWSGQSGQPSWLWGSNDGTNYYVWNPSNFSVAYATNAGTATNATTASALSSTGDNVATSGWYRSNGNVGWYNNTHGGGIYMNDSSWIRTYGNKNFYVQGGSLAVDGNVGIGTVSPGQKLTVVGVIESTSGGIKFPDGSTQTTASTGVTGYQRVNSAGVVLSPGGSGTDMVTCPGAKKVIGGGCRANVATIYNSASYASADNVWTCVFYNAGGGAGTIYAYAICASI